jgi:hypothetical protein
VVDAGYYTFGVNADDTFALRVVGETFEQAHGPTTILDTFSPDTIYSDRDGQIGAGLGQINLAPGKYDIEFLSSQSAGGSGHELFVARGQWTDVSQTDHWRLVGHQSVGDISVPGIKDMQFNVTTTLPGGPDVDSLADAEFELTNTTGLVTAPWSVINFADPDNAGGGGSFLPNNTFDNGTNADDNNFAVEITGTLVIPAAGDFIFGFRGDDGTSLQIENQTWGTIIQAPNATSMIVGDSLVFDDNVADSFTLATMSLAAGEYPLRAVYWEFGGGAHFELHGDSAFFGTTRLLGSQVAGVFTDPDGLTLVAPPLDIVFVDWAYDKHAESFFVEWISESGRQYEVQFSFDAVTWFPVSTITASGPTANATIAGSHETPYALFRIRLVEP